MKPSRDFTICPYCDKKADLVKGAYLYPRRPDLYSKRFWICEGCDAWVGCHDGTTNPLGRLANATLRQAKQRAHAAFDPLWKAKIVRDKVSKKKARGAGYRWLSEQLGIPFDDCHIGYFDEATCDRVVEICSSLKARAA